MCLPFIMFCRFQDATMQSSKWRRKPGMNFMVRSKICTCRTHTHTETQTRCLFVYIFAFYSNSSLHTLSMIAQRRHPGHRLSRNLQILRLRISILSSWNRAENQAAPPLGCIILHVTSILYQIAYPLHEIYTVYCLIIYTLHHTILLPLWLWFVADPKQLFLRPLQPGETMEPCDFRCLLTAGKKLDRVGKGKSPCGGIICAVSMSDSQSAKAPRCYEVLVI